MKSKILAIAILSLCISCLPKSLAAQEQRATQSQKAIFDAMMSLSTIDPQAANAFCSSYLAAGVQNQAPVSSPLAAPCMCCQLEVRRNDSGDSIPRYYRDGTCERKSSLTCAADGCQWTCPAKC